MIGILVWCDMCADYHVHSFRAKFYETVNGDVYGESYWLPHWGVNPFVALNGRFSPEDN
jgi:hypothetical protein